MESDDDVRKRSAPASGRADDETSSSVPGRPRVLRRSLPKTTRDLAGWDPGEIAATGTAAPGGALPHQGRLEQAFGRDLSGIQAHTDAGAQASADQLGAEAYATGDHVVVPPDAGIGVVAHEVTHVLQQQEGVQLLGGIDGGASDPLEQEAEAIGAAVERGESVAHRFAATPSGAARRGGVQRKQSVVAPPAASPPDPQQLRDQRAAALTMVTTRWQAAAPGLFVRADELVGAVAVGVFEEVAYRLIRLDQTDVAPVRAALVGDGRDPYAQALERAADAFVKDQPRLEVIKEAIDQICAGGDVQFHGTRLLAQHAMTSYLGKRALSTERELGLDAIGTYAASRAFEHGEAERRSATAAGVDAAATAGGAGRRRQCDALVDVLLAGSRAAAPALAAPVGDPAQPTDSPAADELKKTVRAGIKTIEDARAKAEPHAPHVEALDAAVGAAPPEVRELVWADKALVAALVQALDPAAAKKLVDQLDPIEALYRECIGVRHEDERRAVVHHMPHTGESVEEQREKIKLREGGTVFQKLKAWLERHPGPGHAALRRGLLLHTKLKDDLIGRLPRADQDVIYRWITNGSGEPSAVDRVHDAAAAGDGVAMVRALRDLASTDPDKLRRLETDLPFRASVEAMTRPVEVDGQPVVPHHLCLLMWGHTPGAASDPGTAQLTQHDADPWAGPLSVEERTKLNTELFLPALEDLYPHTQGKWKGEHEINSQKILDKLRVWERKAAAFSPLLQREGLVFGRELDARFYRKYGIDLRYFMYEHGGPSRRSGVARILGSEQGASVGMFNGEQVLADDPANPQKMSIQQALRETVAGAEGWTISEWASIETRAASREMDDHDKGGVLKHWRRFRDAIASVQERLDGATGRHIRAIDLWRNQWMEHAGHFETRVRVVFGDEAEREVFAEMGLDADVDRAPGAEPPSIGDQARERFDLPAKSLWDLINTIGRRTPPEMFVSLRVMIGVYRSLPPVSGEDKQVRAVAVGHDIEERPPRSFDGYYRFLYGVSPELHVAAAIRATDNDEETKVAAAQTAGISPDLVRGKLTAPNNDDGSIGAHNRHLVRADFTEAKAQSNAEQIWDVLHHDGRFSLIDAELYGNYNDEEQRLIRVAFRRLSGGFDLQFYIRQVMEARKRLSADPQAQLARQLTNQGDRVAMGAEGTEEVGVFDRGSVISKSSDAELDRALAIAMSGEIDCRTRIRNALQRKEEGQIVKLVDELTEAERREVLRDGQLIDDLERYLYQYNYERVFKVLTGQGDMADRLLSRSHGGDWMERKVTGGTDERGMEEDIRSYVRRLKLQYDREVRAEVEARRAEGKAVSQATIDAIPKEVDRRVRQACAAIASDKTVDKVLKGELETDERAEMTSQILNAGEAHDWAVAGGASATEILAEIRRMPLDERRAKLADPNYLRLLGDRLTNEKDYRDAMNALSAVDDGAGGGGLAKLDTHSRTGAQVEGAKKDPRQTLEALADLSPAEFQKIAEDPGLQLQVMSSLDTEEQRQMARDLLAFRFPAVAEGDKDGARAAQLQFLKERAIHGLRVAARTSNKWSEVLEEAVEVYKADLEPRKEPDGPRDLEGGHGLRAQIWTEVEADIVAFSEIHRRDPTAVTSDAITPEAMISTIRSAVLRKADPSDAWIAAKIWTADEQKAQGKAMPFGAGDTRYKEEDLIEVLESASDEHVATHWTSILAEPVDGGPTMKAKYDEFRIARGRAQPALEARRAQAEAEVAQEPAAPVVEVDASAGGAAPMPTPAPAPAPVRDARADADPLVADAEVKRQQFLQFQIEVSRFLEAMLRPYMGDHREATANADPDAAKIAGSRNKRWNNLAEVIYARIPRLGPETIADKLDMPKEDRWLLLSKESRSLREEVGMFQLRHEKNLRHRGAQQSDRSAASGEKEELDTSRILYGRAQAMALTDSMIDVEEKDRLQYLGDENDRAREAYKTALQTSAMWSSLIAGVLVTIVATILTGGLALGPMSMLAIGAATTALSATAKAVIMKETLGDEFDSRDTREMVAQEVITGLVTMGTTYYAQKLLSAVSSVGSLAKQANAAQQVLRKPPPLWKVFLEEASEEALSESMSTVVEAGLEATNPDHWIDGHIEGAKEAKAAGLAKLRTADDAAFTGALTSLVTAGASRVMKRKGGGKADFDVSSSTAKRRVDVKKNIKKVFGDPEEKFTGALVEWAMAQDGEIDWSNMPGELLQGVLQEYNEVGTETHVNSAHAGDRKKRVDKHLAIFGHTLVGSEAASFREMNDAANGTDAFVPIRDYIAIRTEVAMSGLAAWESQHPETPLTTEQREAFVRWVRTQGGTADDLAAAAKRDPLSVQDVIDAGKPKDTVGASAPGSGGSYNAGMFRIPVDPAATAEQAPQPAPQPAPHERATQQMPAVTPAQVATRELHEDFPDLPHLGHLSEDVLGAHQRGAVEGKLRAMDAAQKQAFQSLLGMMPSPVGRGFLFKALAAGNTMADIHWLAMQSMGRDDNWLLDNLTLGDPRGVGAGLTQQWSMSCNAATTLCVRGNYDPVFALGLRLSNSNISQVDMVDPTRHNPNQAAYERGMLEMPYQGAGAMPTGGAGVAAPRASTQGVGRWADDLLNSQAGVTGMRFETEKDISGANVLVALDAALQQGMQVPLVIGNQPQHYGHYVLATQVRRGQDGVFYYRFHNTANGQSTWVSEHQIVSGQLPLAGGVMVTAIEHPVALDRGNGAAQGHGPPDVAPQTSPLTPADAPALANPAVAAVTQRIPVSAAATMISIQAGDQGAAPAAQPQATAAADAATAQAVPTAAPTARTLMIPVPVQQAVAEVVHPQAVTAAQALPARKPGTSRDPAREQFTEQWQGGAIDLGAFKEQYKLEYEDAKERLDRLRQTPEIAAVLERVPEEELVAIILYTSTHFVEWNRTLREQDTGELGLQEHGAGIALADKGLAKMPAYQGTVHRGTELPAEVIAKYVPGQIVTEDAFTSTSTHESGTENFEGNVQFVIESKTGRSIDSLSRYENEKEVLFRPGTQFIVTDKERDGDRVIIRMREVDAASSNAPGGPGGSDLGSASREQWNAPEPPRVLPEDSPLLVETHTIETPERKQLRDQIVADVLADGDAKPVVGRKPVLYLMGGGGASGKGTVKDELIDAGGIPAEGAVAIDPDEIKARIPEYKQIVARGDSRAASVVHEESSAISKRVIAEAYARQLDVVMDVTLGSPGKGMKLIEDARAAGYEIRLIGVTADPSVAVERAGSRATRSGRYVPTTELLKAHRGFSEGFEHYAKLVDEAILFDTSAGERPVVVARKEQGRSLDVLVEQLYESFQRKAHIDPHAAGPATLYRETDARPPASSKQDYIDAAIDNLRRTSRTAAGNVDLSASPDKAKSMAEGVSGDEASRMATRNVQSAVGKLYDYRGVEISDPRALRAFVEQVASEINAGIVKDGSRARLRKVPVHARGSARVGHDSVL